ncbi:MULTISPECIES: sterol desaturase family protein [unclassified Undibacterium]|uniref:sterol desaturase family protein n=1 Tax=unclassified Undibacterium TaxID=2630295 RepID=UPI002AC92815|nr:MULTISPECIES: sterol desaturase family protein [unclassified Undibacterium]MEB0138514.1 sterol desaturase family protein [Undibacterium sp. CCC2.1]MEB0173085.1 sterol desaturase family protein [Undibacterium sp. CCC1.1]MEB0176137.1 sterol desaturase family protein [Undibacterium sp. CCC3.4]MEB0215403.1 sterol desaturase family protein [Undibacterium sp. 5I2]WPX42744.1 sterol desaturase family protein [Undibacterium sp. CCC3.4]
MSILNFEHSRRALIADFVFYAASIPALLLLLWLACPATARLTALLLLVLGLLAASAIEYGIHRYILHGVAPFSDWHKQHHARPQARIGTPTVVSALLIYLLVFCPALMFLPFFQALALTLGGVIAYFVYIVTHHATHHWHGSSRWLRTRKRWHALHHGAYSERCYGVSSALWDHLLGSVPPARVRK